MENNKDSNVDVTTPPATAETVITRRELVVKAARRMFAVMATAGLADQITGGEALNFMLTSGPDANASLPELVVLEALDEGERQMEQNAADAIHTVQLEHPSLSEKDRAMKAIDYLGCTVFAYGVNSLIGGSHIAALHYGMLTAVMAAKYSLSDQNEREHLIAEFQSSAKAGMIISGTVVLAEGIKADLGKAYNMIAGKELSDDTDRTALLTMLSGTMSPLVTTVGSATLCKTIALELANGDMNKAAVLMQYISNSSGFLLFGDPPFIAICEKYGFKEGVKWQAQTMWPMALYSLFSSAYKINLLRAKDEGVHGVQQASWALQETIQGFRRNLPILATIMKASLANATKFYSGADLAFSMPQTEQGLKFNIDEILEEKFQGVVKLFKGQIDSSTHHEDVEGLGGDSPREKVLKEILQIVLDSFGNDEEETKDMIAKLHSAIKDFDFDKIQDIAGNLSIDDAKISPLLVAARKMLKEQTPSGQENESLSMPQRVLRYADYLTNLDNVKGALGHNLGDIVDVFPFQAGCVPFLTTAFRDMQTMIAALLDREDIKNNMPPGVPPESIMEAIMFFIIMGFSSIADNYVACKIGLDLFPTKPEIALVPSVIGGGMSSVGNMANLALFNLEQMPLATSFAKDSWHLDIAGFGLLWTNLLPSLQGKAPFKYIFGAGIQPKVQAATH